LGKQDFIYIRKRKKRRRERNKQINHLNIMSGKWECSMWDGVPVSDPKIVRKEMAIFRTFEAQGTKNLDDPELLYTFRRKKK
jgi:hypothetical protein